MFAVLLQWIPLIKYLGLMLAAIGVFQVIRGRKAFGEWHERLVWCSIVLFVGAGLSAFAFDQAFTYAIQVMGYADLGPAEPGFALTTYESLAKASLIIACQISASFVLLAYGLEDRVGRQLLLAGLALQIAVSVAVFVFILAPYLAQVVPPAFASDPPNANAMQAAAAEITGFSPLRLFDALPAILFAWAYDRAHRRIARGEIPPKERTRTRPGIPFRLPE
jgi:hypothetical protein